MPLRVAVFKVTPDQARRRRVCARRVVAVLVADPDLGEDLSDEQLQLARERALAERP